MKDRKERTVGFNPRLVLFFLRIQFKKKKEYSLAMWNLKQKSNIKTESRKMVTRGWRMGKQGKGDKQVRTFII